MTERIVVYVHGMGGSADEAEHFVPLFPECEVIGFDYVSSTPWEAKEEFGAFFAGLKEDIFLTSESILPCGTFRPIYSTAAATF